MVDPNPQPILVRPTKTQTQVISELQFIPKAVAKYLLYEVVYPSHRIRSFPFIPL